ncbi:meiosis-specific protein MEI4 [Erpetoichthys calabaricus]|uniref:meiosis-specific protein MEI4 n=1 Tax=Erpetoichthys calabaricus TaxID=27687 RepID=UPI0022348FCE|nr:meiosis-specific protein MEI4 [Erpetoichthys calabaricus]
MLSLMETASAVPNDCDEAGECGEGCGIQQRFFRMTRLALALAIIGCKPPGTSGKEHAEYLAACLQCKNENWKEKAQLLEAEVFRLQQELLLVKEVGTMENISEDLRSSLNQAVQHEDYYGYETYNEQNPGILLQCKENSDIAGYKTYSSGNYWALTKKRINPHISFFQNLVGLRKLKEYGNITNPLYSYSECSLITDSVIQLLDGLLRYCKTLKFPFSSKLLNEAVVALSGVMEHGNASNVVVFQKTEKFLKDFAKLILDNGELMRVSKVTEMYL